MLHGVINAGLGWTQLFVKPVKAVKHEGKNVVDGIFEGLAHSVYYTVLGVWDLATFWFPGEGGKQIAAKDCVLFSNSEGSGSGPTASTPAAASSASSSAAAPAAAK